MYIGNEPKLSNFPVDYRSGNSVQVTFGLSYAPASASGILVTISGVVQSPNTYTLSGSTITFSEAPPTGTNNIVVIHLGRQLDIGEPSDGTVTNQKMNLLSPLIVPAGTTAGVAARYEQLPEVNALLNGELAIWQRGTSYTSIATGVKHADMWHYSKAGTMLHDLTRSTDVPTVAQAGVKLNYSLFLNCTTAQASLGVNDYTINSILMEGYDFARYAEKSFTVAFWVKATKTGNYCVSFSNTATDRSFVSNFSVNAANTWEEKTITVTASPTDGTWDFTNGTGLRIRFCVGAGTNLQTSTLNSWVAGNFVASTTQVNAMDAVNNQFRIAFVRMNSGTVIKTHTPRPFAELLSLCERYYEKSYNHDVVPGTNDYSGAISKIAFSSTDFYDYGDIRFKTKKRVGATTTFYSPSGPSGAIRNVTTNSDLSTIGINSSGQSGLRLGATGMAVDNGYQMHFTAESGLS